MNHSESKKKKGTQKKATQSNTESSMQFGTKAECRNEECIGKLTGEEDQAAEVNPTDNRLLKGNSKTRSSMKISKDRDCKNGTCIGLD